MKLKISILFTVVLLAMTNTSCTLLAVMAIESTEEKCDVGKIHLYNKKNSDIDVYFDSEFVANIKKGGVSTVEVKFGRTFHITVYRNPGNGTIANQGDYTAPSSGCRGKDININ